MRGYVMRDLGICIVRRPFWNYVKDKNGDIDSLRLSFMKEKGLRYLIVDKDVDCQMFF
jgi:hypothetical protein